MKFLTSVTSLWLCGIASPSFADGQIAKAAVVETYANIAEAAYSDSLTSAQTLQSAVDTMLADPSAVSLEAAKAAWIAARVPYQQTEVYRFGNAIVDDWEGRVNAWPLDEGLIDYVAAVYGTESDDNALYTANVIANPMVSVDGQTVDATRITPALLSDVLQEAGGNEANVATGYHAIEFLLWGQDLNYDRAGAGARPFTDYLSEGCTGGNCDRRRAYLKAATDLLVSDLQEMVANWQDGGAGRAALHAATPDGALSMMLSGMGSLSYGELAGERMKLGLLLHDPEEEHDCFSDNTHNSHLYDAVGIQNVFLGRYSRLDGSVVTGPSLRDLIADRDPEAATELADRIASSVDAMRQIAHRAATLEAYDQMIGEGNPQGNALVQAAIDALVHQTKSIERAITVLDVGSIVLEGSDSLDNVNAVFE